MQLIRLARRFGAFVSRIRLALRFYFQLGYGWNLAWIKSERAR